MKCPLTGKVCLFKKILHVTEIDDNGETKSLNMCQHCSPDYFAVSDPKQVTEEELEKVSEEFIKEADELLDVFLKGKKPTKQNICAFCGITFKDFLDKQRLGCPHCYTTFKDRLNQVLKRYHGSDEHIGKKPKTRQIPENIEEKKKLLKLQLTRALEFEKYEDAALIKKELDELG